MKRTHDYFMQLLAEHARLVVWFESQHGAKPTSDRQLYTDFFASHFLGRGERASRASGEDFQRSLKTLRNELAEARRIARTCPENRPISGTA